MGYDYIPAFFLSWSVSCDIMAVSPFTAVFVDVDVEGTGSRVIFCILDVFPVAFLCSRRSCGTSYMRWVCNIMTSGSVLSEVARPRQSLTMKLCVVFK